MLDQLNIHVENDVCGHTAQNTHAQNSIIGALAEKNKIIGLLKERGDCLSDLGKGNELIK